MTSTAGLPDTATVALMDAANFIGISRATAYRLAETGWLMDGVPVLRIATRYRVPRAKLLAAVEGEAS